MAEKKKLPKNPAKKNRSLDVSKLSPKAAYEHFLGEARSAGEVHVSRVPPAIAAENVKRAFGALAPYVRRRPSSRRA